MWNRQSTKVRIRDKHDDIASLLQTKLGTKVLCPNKNLLYEDALEAYKGHRGQTFSLAEPVARMKPLSIVKP